MLSRDTGTRMIAKWEEHTSPMKTPIILNLFRPDNEGGWFRRKDRGTSGIRSLGTRRGT